MTAAAGQIAVGTRVHLTDGFAAWCSPCAEGVGPTSERAAHAWADRHNAREHSGVR